IKVFAICFICDIFFFYWNWIAVVSKWHKAFCSGFSLGNIASVCQHMLSNGTHEANRENGFGPTILHSVAFVEDLALSIMSSICNG
ncbi:hypothetical protein J0S82_008254, partial [Galemys pyrenaicus]